MLTVLLGEVLTSPSRGVLADKGGEGLARSDGAGSQLIDQRPANVT